MQQEKAKGLGLWLAQVCKSEGLSLRRAAAKTGLSHSTLADIKKGAKVSCETIRKLAKYFGSEGRKRLVLEDKLLVLAGYRSERPEEDELGEPMAHLMDRLSQLSKLQLNVVVHFVDFLTEMERQ